MSFLLTPGVLQQQANQKEDADLIIEVDTMLGDGVASFELPLRSGYNYDMIVDWGDGTTSEVTAWDDSNKIHSYLVGGTYTIKISGLIESWYFNNSGDKDKILSADFVGDNEYLALDFAFWGCGNIESITGINGNNTKNITDFTNFAAQCVSLNEFDTSKFNTENVENFRAFLYNCSSLMSVDVSNWITDNVKSFAFFAFNCKLLDMIDARFWNTINVRDFTSFARGTEFINILIGIEWNVKSCDRFVDFLLISKITTQQYDDLLVQFDGQNLIDGLTFDAGLSTYTTAGETAKNNIIANHNWTFNDGGLA